MNSELAEILLCEAPFWPPQALSQNSQFTIKQNTNSYFLHPVQKVKIKRCLKKGREREINFLWFYLEFRGFYPLFWPMKLIWHIARMFHCLSYEHSIYIFGVGKGFNVLPNFHKFLFRKFILYFITNLLSHTVFAEPSHFCPLWVCHQLSQLPTISSEGVIQYRGKSIGSKSWTVRDEWFTVSRPWEPLRCIFLNPDTYKSNLTSYSHLNRLGKFLNMYEIIFFNDSKWIDR